ncbi:MAG: DNA polymerase III subunit alpha [Deltaproteobacteria bacterium]|nr:DNA polymerase III subunit alpha [Deltaproteobacteria bacterium]
MFTHLHVHSQYSLLEGAIKINSLIEQVKQLGMNSVAITDSGNLFGAVEFYETAIKAGIKPILGAEIYYLTQGALQQKETKRKDGLLANLVLLVINEVGYKNLCRLLTIAHLEGFYYKPRLDKQTLAQHHEGLFALSGTLKGEAHHHLLEQNPHLAKTALEELASFYPNRLFLEIQDHGLPQEKLLRPELIRLSQETGIPLVATNDCQYLLAQHQSAHQVLHCIKVGRTLKEEEDRAVFTTDQFYLKSPETMQKAFQDLPEALANTQKIAESCEFKFTFDQYYFPKYESVENLSTEELLTKRTQVGFSHRWEKVQHQYPAEKQASQYEIYQKRIEEELAVILKMGFAGYFIIVADFINFAKSEGIPVGPGRGSAAGSLVAYCLNITDINPMPFDLLFERFLNPERISMPDVDIDFCMKGRDRVIEYVTQKYGNVSQIITFGTLKAKAVVRDVGRVLDIPYGEVDRIAKLIPNALNITLEQALKEEPTLQELLQNNQQIRQLIEIAKTLEGLTRHASTHAAGVVIGDRALTEYLPLYHGTHDEIVSQFDMKAVEKIGLVKFDFLGLKTLTVLDIARKIIKRVQNIDIHFDEIPLDDVKVYEQLCSGDSLGIFQLESSGMQDLLVRLKPNRFEDLIALVALYRPGPLGSGMVDDFINRKHGKTKVAFELPQLESILSDTYGVILYQEQVMKIAAVLANFSLGEADLLRRAMGKKKTQEMAKQRERFLKGSTDNHIPRKKAEKIFDLMAKFAEYGFNKSHSAAYALVSYHTAYLKTHYNVEYMASVLTHEMGNTDKILIYINDCKEHGMTLLPPDINESYRYFSVNQDRQIRFGLAAVKGVGDAAITAIIEVREKVGKFNNLFHLCEWADTRKVNKKVLEALIKCGAFDRIDADRASMLANLDGALEWGNKRQMEKTVGQVNMFTQSPTLARVKPWGEKERLTFEKEALGFYITGHPLERYQGQIKNLTKYSIQNLKEAQDKEQVTICGVVSSLKMIRTKQGKKMAFVNLEDLTGSLEVIVFSECYQNAVRFLEGDIPLFVKGRVDAGEDNIKIIAEEILPLDKVRLLKTRSIHFKIEKILASQHALEQLKKILLDYPGHTPAYLHLLAPGQQETILSLPSELSVDINDTFIQKIEDLFGTDSVILH